MYPASIIIPGARVYQPKPAPMASDSFVLKSKNSDIKRAAVRVPMITARGMANMRRPTALKLLPTVPSIPRSIPTNISSRHSPSFMPRPAAFSKASMLSANTSLITKYPANMPMTTEISIMTVIMLTFCFFSSSSMMCTCSTRSSSAAACSDFCPPSTLSSPPRPVTRPYLSMPKSFLVM